MNRRTVLRSLTALLGAPIAQRAGASLLLKPAPGPQAQAGASGAVRAVVFNQLGFRPGHAKRATVLLAGTGPSAGLSFRVLDGAGTPRAEGRLTQPALDAASGDTLASADFSTLDTPGVYRIWAGGFFSEPFTIAEDAYAAALRLTMRGYYGQRCGCKVDLGGGYHHDACHLDGAFHPTSGRSGAVPSHGGWHDAGDYGRYAVNSGISTATLLWAWEMFPQALHGLNLDIPESGRPIPDFLAEIRWNLNWMLSMQDADGGVWHKQTSEKFCAFVMPEQDTMTSYIIGTGSAPYKSTAATADLAAVAAIAARCFRPFDAAYADRCLAAARKAWSWCVANPNVLFRNPPGISTGDYGDRNCDDEILWATAELFRTTGDAQYGRAFLTAIPDDLSLAEPSWSSTQPLAYWTYALAEHANPFVRASIAEATQEAATLRILRASQNGYGNTLRLHDYVWGSNSVAGNDAVLLLMANRLQPNRAAVDAALGNLHYLLGCNCHGVSWVTQLGTRPFLHPHHRPSVADGLAAPWPGLLSGGPNAHGGDAVANALPKQPPMKMWVDDYRAYSMNEICINWNAPLVFLLAAANSSLG